MRPPLQVFLCAFEPSDWVFPAAHSANCCVQVEPTSEAAHPLNSQFNRLWNAPGQGEGRVLAALLASGMGNTVTASARRLRLRSSGIQCITENAPRRHESRETCAGVSRYRAPG